MLIQLVTWLGLTISVMALILIQNGHQRAGWTMNLFNQVIWMATGIVLGLPAFMVSSLIFATVNARGVIKTRRNHVHRTIDNRSCDGCVWYHDGNVLHRVHD